MQTPWASLLCIFIINYYTVYNFCWLEILFDSLCFFLDFICHNSIRNKKKSTQKQLQVGRCFRAASTYTTGIRVFAECFLSGTRQRASFPSAKRKTLGKKNTRQRGFFAECQKNTQQRPSLLSVFLHSAKKPHCRVFFLHSTKTFFAECQKQHWTKKISN